MSSGRRTFGEWDFRRVLKLFFFFELFEFGVRTVSMYPSAGVPIGIGPKAKESLDDMPMHNRPYLLVRVPTVMCSGPGPSQAQVPTLQVYGFQRRCHTPSSQPRADPKKRAIPCQGTHMRSSALLIPNGRLRSLSSRNVSLGHPFTNLGSTYSSSDPISKLT